VPTRPHFDERIDMGQLGNNSARLKQIPWISGQSYLICQIDPEVRSGFLARTAWECAEINAGQSSPPRQKAMMTAAIHALSGPKRGA